MGYDGCAIQFTFEDGGERLVHVSPGESLLEAAKKANVAIDAPCSGNGSCGKCRVRLLSGELRSEANRHIDADAYAAGLRLACASFAAGDAVVLVPDIASAYKSKIKTADLRGGREAEVFAAFRRDLTERGLAGDSGVEIVSVALPPPSPDDPAADRERLLISLAAALGFAPGEDRIDISLYALRKLPRALRAFDFSARCVLRREKRGGGERAVLLDIFPANEEPPLAGLAIDIGTTTVSALLADLRTGAPIAEGSAGNGQIRYGADVINRIIESARPGGSERLRRALLDECILPLTAGMCEACDLPQDNIYRVAVTANTTMLHLFAGVCADYLRLEPYVPAFFGAGVLRGADLGLGAHPDAEVVFAPCVGSYVGGDITAGAFSSGIYRSEAQALLLDLGTNGELVFGNADFLMCCACSAGPAFEGGDISCGMRATDGAIESCRIDAESTETDCTVIGPRGARAAGFCGTGLIDLIGELFRCGIINARGKIVRAGRRVYRDEAGVAGYITVFADESESGRDISISEIDIDNFIRAKGAIFSAIRTMLAIAGADAADIASVYIAGGIGSGIDTERAVRVGMLPDLSAERFRYVGNTSLAGAYAMLTSRAACEEIARIAEGMIYLELSSHPGYMDEFIAACFLPHTDATLFGEARR
ncbi:MAG: ASKHA domain-containing protein [Clostridiales Family XIII bacterium]|nr:ASKHA domain-containing protein [Clostridiales Family XIII bacterium]